MFCGNHRTGIGYRKTNPLATFFHQRSQADCYFSILGSKLKGIGEQIEINTFQFLYVRQCMVIRIRHIVKRKMNMLFAGCRQERFVPTFKEERISTGTGVYSILPFSYLRKSNI